MNLLLKNNYNNVGEGIISIVPPEKSYLKFIGFNILKIKKNNSFCLLNHDFETALVIFYGRCSIFFNGLSYENIGGRKDIFEENTTAVYVPVGEEVRIEAFEDTEIALSYARTFKKKDPFMVKPEDVNVTETGKENYKRSVKKIIYDIHDVDKFIIGEVVSRYGSWSSFPPHKHDRDKYPVETKFEEIYHFRIYPPQGFALQRIYTEQKDIDETYTIENYDTVIIPKGYHPVVGCPGYKTYYFWILGGEKRVYKFFEDERHSWCAK